MYKFVTYKTGSHRVICGKNIMSKKNIKDFKYFEISNPETINGGITVIVQKCLTLEVKVCVSTEIKHCAGTEVKCTSPFSIDGVVIW